MTWLVAAFLKRTLKQRNRVLRAAACLTTVSPWHVACLKSFNRRVELIYNGYDPEIFYPAPRRSERFYITYTGRVIHPSLRDPELLFRAVARLVEEKVISSETFRIRWFTDEKSRRIICRETERHALASYTEFHDYVPASRIPALLNESAVLLLLSNKTGEAGPKGVMTTKFFEALAVERPILCVRGDEGCLEEAILRTHAGLSAHNEEEVYRFIITCYRQWQLTGETRMEVDRKEVETFSRKVQADQFIRMFEEITDTR